MSTTLRFREHANFHRSTLLMVAGGLVAALIGYALMSPAASPWALAVVAMAAMVGSLSMSYGPLSYDLAARLGLGSMAAAALVALGRAGHPDLAIGAFGLLFGAGLGWGLRGPRLLVAIGLGALVAVLGRSVFMSITTAQQFADMPGWLVSAGAGAAFSLVSVFGLLPRHLDVQRDPVDTTYQALEGSLSGEVADLVGRGYKLWNKSKDELEADDVNRETLREAVLRLFEVAQRWLKVDKAGNHEAAESLVARIDALDERIAKTEDAVTAGQYREAKAALVEQLRYMQDINVNRERVLARMHNYLAAMERLRMAVINLETTNASRSAVDVQPLIANMQSIGADMDSCSTALVEVDQAAVLGATPAEA